jgi:hypothetical protein
MASKKPPEPESIVIDEELLDAILQWGFGEDMFSSEDPILEQMFKPLSLPRDDDPHGKRRDPT